MTLNLEAGKWYRRKSGQLAYVIGPAIPPCSENAKWLIQVDDMQTIVTGNVSGEVYRSVDAIVEELPDCTGWDWQPPEPKSLGEKLCDATSKGWWALISKVEREEYQKRAEKFLRSVTPQEAQSFIKPGANP